MALSWRRATEDDAVLLWQWANDVETRRQSFNDAPIPYADHVGWLEARLASGSTRLWIFSDARGPVGQVRVDRAGDVAEINIAVAPERRGQGLGTAMLREALGALRSEWGDGVRPRAQVFGRNAASVRMFRRCGFREIATRAARGEPVVVFELSAADTPR
jgi:RimJ/RimL family protein N-acetyltransferase